MLGEITGKMIGSKIVGHVLKEHSRSSPSYISTLKQVIETLIETLPTLTTYINVNRRTYIQTYTSTVHVQCM